MPTFPPGPVTPALPPPPVALPGRLATPHGGPNPSLLGAPRVSHGPHRPVHGGTILSSLPPVHRRSFARRGLYRHGGRAALPRSIATPAAAAGQTPGLASVPAQEPAFAGRLPVLPSRPSHLVAMAFLSSETEGGLALPLAVARPVCQPPVPLALAVPPSGDRGSPLPTAKAHGNWPIDLAGAAAAALPSGPRLSSREAQEAATDAGDIITLTAIRASEKMTVAARLIPLLPPYAVAAMLSSTEQRVAAIAPDRVVSRLIRIISQTGVSTIKGALSAWTRMLRWAGAGDVQTGARFDGWDTADFLETVHIEALAKVAETERRRALVDARLARLGRPPVVRGRNVRDASSAREAAAAGLGWLQRKCKVDVAVGDELVRAFRIPRRPPEGSEPLSIKYAVGLEMCAASHESPFVKGQSAAHVFDALACLRLEQSGFCMLEFEDGGAVHGFVGKDKHPVPSKQRARPFWAPTTGMVSGRAFMDSLYGMLDGVEAGCFLLRDTDSPDGDPRLATRWVNAPCVGSRAVASLRACLEEAGATKERAKCFGTASARRFLPEVAEGRGEPSHRRVEIGKWSGATAQDMDLAPHLRAAMAHTAKHSVLPDRYARRAKVTRVIRIMCEQVAAVRELVCSGAPLPDAAGWELLPECPAANHAVLEVVGGLQLGPSAV